MEGLNYSVTKCKRAVCSCIYCYQQMSLKVHCLAYENEYTGKTLEKCGIHLTRGIFIYKICIFIFGTETESHVETAQMLQMLQILFLWYG